MASFHGVNHVRQGALKYDALSGDQTVSLLPACTLTLLSTNGINHNSFCLPHLSTVEGQKAELAQLAVRAYYIPRG